MANNVSLGKKRKEDCKGNWVPTGKTWIEGSWTKVRTLEGSMPCRASAWSQAARQVVFMGFQDSPVRELLRRMNQPPSFCGPELALVTGSSRHFLNYRTFYPDGTS